MTTIEIDEITRNSILAALDGHAQALEKAIRFSQWCADDAASRGAEVTEDTQRAIVWNIAALHDCNMARLQVAEAGEPVQTIAEAVPWEPAAKVGTAYHDWQAD